MDSKAQASGPLAGVRVLDMTSVLMGPSATQMLADLGADVVKVESPQGDVVRAIGPQGGQGLGPIFLALNRGKRSIALDLKQADGLQALLDLAAGADVLAYNVRPAAMRRLGLDYETLSALNPRLVYLGMFGFSERGRYAGHAAFDDLIQAGSALPHAQARHTGEAPRYLPFNVADRMVGQHAFGVICAALYARERTGRGQRVDVPMFETMVQQALGDHLYGETFVPAQGGCGYPRLLARERRPYATRDGHVCCLVYTDSQWRAFLGAVGQGGRFDTDPRLASLGARTRHIDELYGLVAQEIARRTTAELQALLADTDIPVFPLHTFESVLEDPHLADIGFFQEAEHPEVGRIRQMARPSEWGGSPPAPPGLAPRLGQHGAEVLREIGYAPERIEHLRASGALKD
ncbi:MAG TPA: CoA transferase [Ramlibacter sp.]|nr:CoA transferase [Ramlibacter sp.]